MDICPVISKLKRRGCRAVSCCLLFLPASDVYVETLYVLDGLMDLRLALLCELV
jgi:hypothetical protein